MLVGQAKEDNEMTREELGKCMHMNTLWCRVPNYDARSLLVYAYVKYRGHKDRDGLVFCRSAEITGIELMRVTDAASLYRLILGRVEATMELLADDVECAHPQGIEDLVSVIGERKDGKITSAGLHISVR